MARRTAPRASGCPSSAPTITALSSSHSAEMWRLRTGLSSSSPESFASSLTLPRASRTADSAVRKSPAPSALRRMLSVFDCRARTWRSRSSAREASSAWCAFASLAGKWLLLCRRTDASETSYSDATERFDASPARVRSMASLSGCSQMVQLRGIVRASRYRLFPAQEPLGRPYAHGHGQHQVVVFAFAPTFEVLATLARPWLEAEQLIPECGRKREPFGYLEFTLIEEDLRGAYQVPSRDQVAHVRAIAHASGYTGDRNGSVLEVGAGPFEGVSKLAQDQGVDWPTRG